ncbi:hypothetical protein [Glacieibacterium sp.]|uniref:hypothetical protein n=1 Tax=Glacieibacterium sp. TaxID=2860237 RepID=UPI003B00CC13
MAFLELNEGSCCGTPAVISAPAPVQAEVVGFSSLEWTVVSLAQSDSPRSIGRVGAVEKLLRMLLGAPRDPSLANPRLETLRYTALAARRWGRRLPGDAVAAFHNAGFSRAQLATLIRSVEFGAGAAKPVNWGRLA